MQDERYVASADLGSGKIAISVAKIDGDDVQIVYYKESHSEGIVNSIVRNPSKAAFAMKEAVSEAEKELNIKINQIVVGLPRAGVQQQVKCATLKRSNPDSCITMEEIDALKNMALDSYPLEDEEKQEIYGAVAQNFSADDLINQSEDDIEGTISDSIEGNFKIFVGNKKAVSNITAMANMAGMTLARQYFVPDAVAKAVLTSGEMENGVALVEIGAEATSLTIYHNDILRHYSAIPFGGGDITSDIKYECGFKKELAENIKLAYGSCQPEKLQNLSDKILQINDEENGTYEHLTVHYLAEIINARTREIIDAILWLIQDSGYADKLRDGIVITGGGANLVGICSLFKEMSGYRVRIGYPRVRHFCSSVCPGVSETSASASIGLILKAKEDKYINCVGELPAKTEAPETEEEGETEDYGGTVFEGGSVIEPGRGKRSRNRGRDKEKAGKANNITWADKLAEKVSSRLGTAFDSTLGTIFDDMGKEQ